MTTTKQCECGGEMRFIGITPGTDFWINPGMKAVYQ